MPRIAIIGGTGLNQLAEGVTQGSTHTDWGVASCSAVQTEVAGQGVYFLARHGNPPRIPPHKINYRANMALLKSFGVEKILAVNAVGGISADCGAGSIVVPDDIIDYTYGREHSYCDGSAAIQHVDFTYPFCEQLRGQLFAAADSLSLTIGRSGVYAATQGPRLESAAEIDRLERDGADIVGMTAMPEAALARELDMAYASICLVVNPAAGRSESLISLEDIHRVVDTGMKDVRALLAACLPLLAQAPMTGLE